MRTAYDMVAAPLGLRRVKHSSARNLVQEFIGLPFFVGSLGKHRAFLAYALRMLRRGARFSVFTLNNLRSLERKIGVYEILRRSRKGEVVLVDEGTLLAAHNIFVFSGAAYTPEEIARFARLAPLPDRVVYIKAPEETLVRRSLARRDPPRELRSRDPEMVRRDIGRAVGMFDQLVQDENIRSRLLVVENCDYPDAAQGEAAEKIVRFITDPEWKAEIV